MGSGEVHGSTGRSRVLRGNSSPIFGDWLADQPSGTAGWEVRLAGSVIASHLNTNGWSATLSSAEYPVMTVGSPASAELGEHELSWTRVYKPEENYPPRIQLFKGLFTIWDFFDFQAPDVECVIKGDDLKLSWKAVPAADRYSVQCWRVSNDGGPNFVLTDQITTRCDYRVQLKGSGKFVVAVGARTETLIGRSEYTAVIPR